MQVYLKMLENFVKYQFVLVSVEKKVKISPGDVAGIRITL